MVGPELPVIYENPKFDAATPTLQPVINRAIRFGAVLMLEWGSLSLIEDAPKYTKVATVVIAILVLAVHESWPWLRMRSKRLYPALMVGLIAVYAAIFGYAFFAETPKLQANAPTAPSQTSVSATPVPTKATEIPRPSTKAGLSRALDTILPELSDLVVIDGAKVRDELLKLPNEGPADLVYSGRPAADAKVRRMIADLQEFSQKVRAFRDKYQLDSNWIDWIIGDHTETLNSGIIKEAIDNADKLRQVIDEITLPPAYSPQMLLEFWQGAQTTFYLPQKAADFGNWLAAMRSRIRNAHDDFEKKLAVSSP